MNRPWKVIFAFVGVFLAGGVFGGFVSLRLVKHHLETARRRGPVAMEQFSPQIFKRLSDRLELTDEQKEKLRPIIRQADADLRRLRQTGTRDAMAVAERMHGEVAALLTPAQMEKQEKLKQEMRERWAKDRQFRRGERPTGERPPPTPTTDAVAEPKTPVSPLQQDK